jgi:hypothetical protein
MYYGPPPRGMRYGRAPVSLMCGFRPPWDETFRADGATDRIFSATASMKAAVPASTVAFSLGVGIPSLPYSQYAS